MIVTAPKRIYIGLLSLGVGLMALMGGAICYAFIYRPHYLVKGLLVLIGAFLLVAVPFLLLGLMGIVLSILSERRLPSFENCIHTTMNLLLPIVVLLGKALRVGKEPVERSFVSVNNYLVRLAARSCQPNELLVLLPHCLQDTECSHKITVRLNNCQRCGRCPVGPLLDLHDEIGFFISVATGGSQARRIVKDRRPKAIIAVACERELTSGIQDVGSIPVLGILNQRPEGPCRNTRVDPLAVRQVLEHFLRGDD